MITVQNIEQLNAIAGAVLRKRRNDIALALPEFVEITTNTRLVGTPLMASIECAARDFLVECLVEQSSVG